MVRLGKYILTLGYKKDGSIIISLDLPRIACFVNELSSKPKPLSTMRFIINNMKNTLNNTKI